MLSFVLLLSSFKKANLLNLIEYDSIKSSDKYHFRTPSKITLAIFTNRFYNISLMNKTY